MISQVREKLAPLAIEIVCPEVIKMYHLMNMSTAEFRKGAKLHKVKFA